MDEKIKALWTNHRILFFVLLPLIAVGVLVMVFRDLVLSYLIGSARKVSNEAKRTDDELTAKSNQAKMEATNAQTEAKAAGARIEERKAADISDDWYKKSN